MYDENRLELVLMLLRVSVFAVMLVWTIDKFVNPAHGAAVFSHFYGIDGLSAQSMQIIAVLELIILAGFITGLFKTFTYGAVLIFHAVSTLSSWNIYMQPFAENHLLFFAAWPMLAACLGLFLLRDSDTLLSLGK
ncbi:MAG: hypothetical protein R3352_06895 [Salinisphaeraceae bacterium]|nr:hypothetical protein [Salinisphaeraceae bacterium]